MITWNFIIECMNAGNVAWVTKLDGFDMQHLDVSGINFENPQ